MDIKVFLLLGLIGLASCKLPFERTCRDKQDKNTKALPTNCSNYKNIEHLYDLHVKLEKRTDALTKTTGSQNMDLSQLMEDFKKMKREISEINKTHNSEISMLKKKVSFLERRKQIISGNFSQIEKKLDETEKQLTEKKEKLQGLETETKELLQQYKSELSNLNTTAQNLQLRLEDQLTATRTDLKAEVKRLNDKDKELKTSLQTNSHADATLRGEVDKLKTAVNTKVAFSASITEGPNVFTGPRTGSSSSVLIFNHVFTNIGNNYNKHTGIFTAPVKGVYQFTFMTFGYYTHTSGAILVKNGHYQVSTWEFKGPDHSDTTSNTVILQLNRNDCINMILWQGGKIHTGVFSGFLLFTV